MPRDGRRAAPVPVRHGRDCTLRRHRDGSAHHRVGTTAWKASARSTTIAELLEQVRPDFRLRWGPSPAPRNAWIIIGNNDSWIDRRKLDGINADPGAALLPARGMTVVRRGLAGVVAPA